MSCDLHSHSTCSDGELSPTALIDAAHAAGIEILALTDHDTTAGHPEASVRAHEVGLELIPAIELSISEDAGKTQFHLLAYGFDLADENLQSCLAQLEQARVERARRCLDRLAELGIELDWEALRTRAGMGTIGRPHVAQALVEAGICSGPDEAFARFLRRGRPAFVPSPGLSAGRALALIHAAGGVVSLAHPFLSGGVEAAGGIEMFVGRLAALGLDAIEVHHPRHKRAQRQRLGQLARRYGLLVTGGSDFHGSAKPDAVLGAFGVERDRFEELRARFRAS